MKSVGGTLRRKGLGGAEHFMRKDKNKSNSSSISAPTVVSTTSPSITGSPIHASPKSVHPPKVAPTKPAAPITVDLHRFADENLQPEECKNKQCMQLFTNVRSSCKENTK